ncbi:MAG: hypothetical protein EA376_09280 [Phycisphaeraceae bacterium]|nr:MAG: hypothetical protein EA376_09280 [Phycisphaeraceae bacterium]
MRTAKRERVFAIVSAVIVGALALSVFVATSGAQQRRAAAPVWEYGQLRLVGHDAVLWTNGGAYFIEGPDRRDAERVEGSTRLRLVKPLLIHHLNAVGPAGWEVVPVPSGTEETTMLLRRPI